MNKVYILYKKKEFKRDFVVCMFLKNFVWIIFYYNYRWYYTLKHLNIKQYNWCRYIYIATDITTKIFKYKLHKCLCISIVT